MPDYLDRLDPFRRLLRRIAGKYVPDILVLGRQNAVRAVDAAFDVDFQCPACHAARSCPLSHFSTSTQQLFGMIPSAVLVIWRAGVRRLRQPPRSTSPTWLGMRSSTAQDSLPRTTPCIIIAETPPAKNTEAVRLEPGPDPRASTRAPRRRLARFSAPNTGSHPPRGGDRRAC